MIRSPLQKIADCFSPLPRQSTLKALTIPRAVFRSAEGTLYSHSLREMKGTIRKSHVRLLDQWLEQCGGMGHVTFQRRSVGNFSATVPTTQAAKFVEALKTQGYDAKSDLRGWNFHLGPRRDF
jgi:hypothetical protein